jgi:glycosyltransferase involved in cell wall biosynthesis
MNRVLLISNRVMHYRVSVYNYFHERFSQAGWEFQVLANELQEANPHPIRFPFQMRPFQFSTYRKEIRRARPSVVILFLHLKTPILWLLMHWLKLARIPVVFWTKTRNLDDPNNPLRNVMFDYLMLLADGLILYTDELMANVPGPCRKKAFPANNSLNFHDFPPIAESKESIKRDLGLPFQRIVLFAGRIGESGNRKKVDHLIEMFRRLDRTDVGLVIVGSGLPAALKARMNPANTRYLGEVQDPENRQISRIFKMSDVCAIPGHVGLGLNHAFYWGLPLVTERGLQPPELCYLQDGQNGFLVPENDVDALRSRLLQLLDDDSLRERFARHARATILQRASIEGMFDGFLRACEHVHTAPLRPVVTASSEPAFAQNLKGNVRLETEVHSGDNHL